MFRLTYYDVQHGQGCITHILLVMFRLTYYDVQHRAKEMQLLYYAFSLWVMFRGTTLFLGQEINYIVANR